MAIESPLKKDVQKATKDLDSLQRLFNVFFQGGIEDPPLKERKQFEALLSKIKSQTAASNNAGDKFQANALVTRFQGMAARWDKTLNGILNGTIAKPKKRE